MRGGTDVVASGDCFCFPFCISDRIADFATRVFAMRSVMRKSDTGLTAYNILKNGSRDDDSPCQPVPPSLGTPHFRSRAGA